MPSNPKEILGAKHLQYTLHEAAWRREERRLYGGDAVLTEEEFPKWRGEEATHYASRVAQARYLNFPEMHASILAGHLARARPSGANFSLGTMGAIRERSKLDTPTLAELFYYNVDGIGNNGTEFPAWTDAVQMRALATGLRWCMVEMPALADIRRGARDPESATQADVQRGFRPYAVEYSPLRVPMWELDRGRLDWAVVLAPVSSSREVRGQWQASDNRLGYYLLVREGFTGLGDEYAGGGWWLFDPDMNPLTEAANGGSPITGTWAKTRGEIPLFPLVAQDSLGTEERPAMARSLTMELGQLSIGLMNRISERDYDAADAARSTKYILGTDPENPDAFNLTADMHNAGSLLVAVPAWLDKQGTAHVPTLYDSSAGAIASGVYQQIVASALEEAREIMVRQVTSTPDSSGRSKEAGFTEATSPLLARLAAQRQRFENTLIYFAELRAGATNPSGFSEWRRDFNLRDVVADIDEGLEILRRTQLRSATAEVEGTMTMLREKGMVREENDQKIRDELTESAQRRTQLEDLDRELLSGAGRGDREDDDEDTLPVPTDRSAAPVSAEVGLNGAQITAALEVIHSLRNQDPALRIAPEAATELLVALGIAPDRARIMVSTSMKDLPPVRDPEEQPTPPPAVKRTEPNPEPQEA